MRKKRPVIRPPGSSKNSESKFTYNSLIHLLARRDHSEKELVTKLGRFHTPEAVQKALALAHERKYIKPPEELSLIMGEWLHKRDKGIRHINQKLKAIGLPPMATDEERELAKCRDHLTRRFGEVTQLSTPERVKAFRYLTNRGFDAETIKRVINEKR